MKKKYTWYLFHESTSKAARNNMALTMPTKTAVPKTHRSPSFPLWVQTFCGRQ